MLKLLRDSVLANQVFDDIFAQVKHRILTRVGPSNADVFTTIQWLDFLTRSSEKANIKELLTLAGKLVILYVKSRVDNDKLRAELALTYALKLRSACTGHICEKVIAEKVTEIMKNTEISESHLAALFFLASKNRKEYRLVGCLDDDGHEIILVGQRDRVLKVANQRIEIVPANKKKENQIIFPVFSTQLLEASAKLLMTEVTISVSQSGGPMQLKKSDKNQIIDQFARYLLLQAKFCLSKRAPVIEKSAALLKKKNKDDVVAFINRAFTSQPIRHTFNRFELLELWKDQILSGRGKLHDNNASSFSASLFATNILERNPERPVRKTTKKKKSPKVVPSSLLCQMSEMGFPEKLVSRAFTALTNEGADPGEINNNMLVERILDIQHGQELLFFEESDSSSISSESGSEIELYVPDRVRPRSDFGDLPFEYEVYVRDNVKPGSRVILLKQYEGIRDRSIGKVRTVNNTMTLRSESIEVEFYRSIENSASFYPTLVWVKPCDIELVDHGLSPFEEKPDSKISVGQHVNILPTCIEPIYGWGGATLESVGVVRDITCGEVVVDFPTHLGWKGRIDQIEVNNEIKRIVNDPERIIEKCEASSNREKCVNLFDGSCDLESGTFWKSCRADQNDDQIWIEIKIRPDFCINYLRMRVDYHDQSFMPTNMVVYTRENSTSKKNRVKEVNIRDSATFNKAIVLLGKQDKYFSHVRLQINTMLQGGNDCKIRGLEISATCKPLKIRTPTWPSSINYDMSNKSKVYVWGLNDSDQILKRHGRIFDPLLSKQLTALRPKMVTMSAKGTAILSETGKVYVIGDLAPKPATASGAELRLVEKKDGDSNLGLVKISAHCTGKHWLGLDRFDVAWACTGEYIEKIMENVRDISAGQDYSLLVTKDGSVYGWGSNANHRISPEETEFFDSPVRIPIDSNIFSVTAGSLAGCSLALDWSGNVYGWGMSKNYQLGMISDDVIQPIKIDLGEHPIRQLASGADFSAALNEKGQIVTWGRKQAGRLGHAEHDGCPRSIEVSNVVFTRVICGAMHCMATDSAGSLWTWGDNSHGQLGQEQTMIRSPQIIIKNLVNIAGLAAGSGHACYWEHCFARAKGSLLCCNFGETSQFGSLGQNPNRSDLVDSLTPGARENIGANQLLVQNKIEASVEYCVANEVLSEFVSHSSAEYFNIAWDLAKKMLYKRIPLNRNLFHRLWLMIKRNPQLLWEKFEADCRSVAGGTVPLSESLSSSEIVSNHPYKNEQKTQELWINPAVSSVQMSFDLNCHIEQNHDFLRITNFDRVLMDLTGKFGPRQSIEMPVNYLRFCFESDAKVSFWGYEITLKPLYELDIGVRLTDSEILSLPHLKLYQYMTSPTLIEAIPADIGKKVTRSLLQCLMKSSLISAEESFWLFELAAKERVISIFTQFQNMVN